MGLFGENVLFTLVMAGNTSFCMIFWLCGLWLSGLSISKDLFLLLNCQEFLPSGNQDSGEQKGVSNKHQLQQKLLSFQPTFGLHDKAKGMVQDVKSCAV